MLHIRIYYTEDHCVGSHNGHFLEDSSVLRTKSMARAEGVCTWVPCAHALHTLIHTGQVHLSGQCWYMLYTSTHMPSMYIYDNTR